MDQILACLLAKMNAVQERMEAKMDTNQEKTDNGQEEMKTQVVLSPRSMSTKKRRELEEVPSSRRWMPV
jgi:hypothetical protein